MSYLVFFYTSGVKKNSLSFFLFLLFQAFLITNIEITWTIIALCINYDVERSVSLIDRYSAILPRWAAISLWTSNHLTPISFRPTSQRPDARDVPYALRVCAIMCSVNTWLRSTRSNVRGIQSLLNHHVPLSVHRMIKIQWRTIYQRYNFTIHLIF